MTFSTRLNKALKDAQKSQTDLAEHLGVTPQAVQQWCMTNGTTPRAKRTEAIAAFLGCSYPWLVTGESQSNMVAEPAASYDIDSALEKEIRELSSGDVEKVASFIQGLKAGRS